MALRMVYPVSYTHIGMAPSSDQRMNVYLGLSPLGLGLQHRPHHNISAACHRHVRWRFALCILHLATYIHIGMTPPSDQRMNACIVFSPLGFGLLHRSRSINKIYQRRTTAARAFALRIVYSATHIHIGMVPSSDQRMNFYIGVSPLGFGLQRRPHGVSQRRAAARARALALRIVYSASYIHICMIPSSDQRMTLYIGFQPMGFRLHIAPIL